MLRLVPFLCFFIAFSNALAQSQSRPAWSVLAAESTAVLVGNVLEGNLWVINPEREAKARGPRPDGKTVLWNPDDYVLGVVKRFHVQEIIKKDGRVKPGDTINVFAFGYFQMHVSPMLADKQKCVLFLRPLETNNKDLADAVIERPGFPAPPGEESKFDPKGYYTVVRRVAGEVVLRLDNLKVIDEIKQAVAKGP
jgi:hypothetical protein